MRSRFLVIFSVTCFILAAGLISEPVSADTGWTPDAKVPGYLDDTYTPFLIADRNRTVHAFASQWVKDGRGGLAITYRKWTLMGGWTRPVDIILSPTASGNANFVGAYLDSSDIFHIIFTSKEPISGLISVYYSYAPAASADWAPAWSPPLPIATWASSLNSGAIVGDDQGNLIVIYSGLKDGSGVYFVQSNTSGGDWSESLPMFLTEDSNLSTFSLRLTTGPEQKIRAAWNVVTNLGVDQAVYFSDFDLEDSKWSTPNELDRKIDIPEYFGPSFPAIADNGQDIIVLYNSGNPYSDQFVAPGRPIMQVASSRDGGVTWSGPFGPFPLLNGRSGEHALAVDGTGAIHGVFIMRIDQLIDGKYKSIGGIWHSQYKEGIWTNPDRLITTVAPHDVHAVISQGNVLLLVWREDPGGGQSGIWYSYKILNVPETQVIPLSGEYQNYPLLETATVLPKTATPELPIESDLLTNNPSNLGKNPALPVIVSSLIVVIVLAGVLLGYRISTSRK